LKVKKDYIEKKKLSFKNVNEEFNSVDFEDDDWMDKGRNARDDKIDR
jgi:hypothetical protein